MIDDLWYKNAVFYSLDLETFMDANGDGVGDFAGLTRRLEYLHALGVDAVWLAPFQRTPNRDNGYDIADYYAVDDRHGTVGDFAEFMHAANKVGIKVVIDLVINHTSDEHPWFRDARSAEDARHRDWYVWSDKKPKDAKKGVIFPGVQEATWTRDEATGAYYFHRFYEFQPDLNMSNPAVRREVLRIMGYYLALGVAGFRVDAVPFVLETQEPGQAGRRKIRFEILEEMRRFLQWRRGDAVLLGEANVSPKKSRRYFGEKGEGLHLMFNFFVNQHLFYALASGDVKPLKRALDKTRDTFPTSQWAHFLRNHDELDLGRLTERRREAVFAAFGPEPEMQLYERGIRRRLQPMLGSRPRIELANSLLFALPGTPVLRYGDEIGMGEDLSLDERDAVRTPMQWSHEENAGFSAAEPGQLVHPVVDEGPFAFARVNVEAQTRDPQSLMSWMQGLIRLRKSCPEIGYGEWDMPETGEAHTLALRYRYRGTTVLTIHNFDAEARVVAIDLGAEAAGLPLVDLRNPTEILPLKPKGSRYELSLGAYGYCWLRLRGVHPVVDGGVG